MASLFISRVSEIITRMFATRDDVVRCYQLIFNRMPETEAAIAAHLAPLPTVWALIADFLDSDEKKRIDSKASKSLSFNKCLASSYIANNFEGDAGLQCYLHNLRFIQNEVRYDFLTEILHKNLELHSFKVNDIVYRVSIQYSRDIENEGELSLYFKEGSNDLFVLAFTVVPGSVLRSAARDVVLVSRMQGLKGQREAIRGATKAAGEVDPQAYLFAILKGIAKASDIDEVYGVTAANQVCYDAQFKDAFERAYDQFLAQSGLEGPTNGFYRAKLPIDSKPLSKIAAWHRSRTKSKREARHQITQAACDRWLSFKRFDEAAVSSLLVVPSYGETTTGSVDVPTGVLWAAARTPPAQASRPPRFLEKLGL